MAKLFGKQLVRLCPVILGLLLSSAPCLAAPAQNSTAPLPGAQSAVNATLGEDSTPKALGAEESFLRTGNATAGNELSGPGEVSGKLTAHNATSLGSVAAESAGLETPAFSWGGYFKGIGALFLILAALWGVVWFLRRRGALPGMGGLPRDAFSVEAQLALSPKKKLILVRFLNSRLLLGVTDQHITLLKEVEGPDGREESTKSTARSFAEVIKDASQKNDAP